MSDVSDSSSYEVISEDEGNLDEHYNSSSTSGEFFLAPALSNEGSVCFSDSVLSTERTGRQNIEKTIQTSSVDGCNSDANPESIAPNFQELTCRFGASATDNILQLDEEAHKTQHFVENSLDQNVNNFMEMELTNLETECCGEANMNEKVQVVFSADSAKYFLSNSEYDPKVKFPVESQAQREVKVDIVKVVSIGNSDDNNNSKTNTKETEEYTKDFSTDNTGTDSSTQDNKVEKDVRNAAVHLPEDDRKANCCCGCCHITDDTGTQSSTQNNKVETDVRNAVVYLPEDFRKVNCCCGGCHVMGEDKRRNIPEEIYLTDWSRKIVSRTTNNQPNVTDFNPISNNNYNNDPKSSIHNDKLCSNFTKSTSLLEAMLPLLPRGNSTRLVADDNMPDHLNHPAFSEDSVGSTISKNRTYCNVNEIITSKQLNKIISLVSSRDNSGSIPFTSTVSHLDHPILNKCSLNSGTCTNMKDHWHNNLKDLEPNNTKDRMTLFRSSARKTTNNNLGNYLQESILNEGPLNCSTSSECTIEQEDNLNGGQERMFCSLVDGDSIKMARTNGIVNRLPDSRAPKYPLGSTSNLNDVSSITRTENFKFVNNSQSHYHHHVTESESKYDQRRNSDLSPAGSWYNLQSQSAPVALRTARVSYGVFDWLRRNQSVQGILRKARNSFNNILVTLDPGMEHVIGTNDELNISVITNDESETRSIRKAFQKVFQNSTYAFVNSVDDVIHDLPPQPIGFLSGLLCAERKINFMREIPNSKDILLAISPILVEATELRWHGCHCILLDDPTRDLSLHVYTQTTPVPNDYIYQSEIRTPATYPLRNHGLSYTLGQTLATLTGAPPSDWQKTLSGLSYYTTLENAAETMAGMYQCYVNGWME